MRVLQRCSVFRDAGGIPARSPRWTLKTALGRTPPLDIREVFVSVPLDKRGALVKVEIELVRLFDVRVQLTVKIRRAHGGCLGTRRR